MILGAFASRNPLASLGGSREMKLVMAYELPFILAACVPIMRARSVQLTDILAAPPVAHSFSGLLALLVALVAMQARLTRVPFDIPEAECELASGVLIEYSGPPLAMYRLTQAMMLFTGPIFLLVLYAGGIPFSDGWQAAAIGGLKLLGIVTLVVLIRNTAPRLRIDQAMRLLWGPVTLAAILSLILVHWGA
jgi:NADH-quinone oxidoreductase subunit H